MIFAAFAARLKPCSFNAENPEHDGRKPNRYS